MKWGLQHVKVTLEEEETGETVVIEQQANGTVRCEPGKRANKPAAERPAPREASRERSREPAAERSVPAHEPAAETKSTPREPAAKPASREPEPANEGPPERRLANRARKTSTLEWKATRDAGFDGFFARSGSGQFKVLNNGVWALFFERRNELPERLGCYKKLPAAKEVAQRLHDRGMRESEITPEQVNAFCPPDATPDDPPPRGERKQKKEPEAQSEATQKKPEEATATDEEEALRSLRAQVKSLVTDDDD
jgi:hypothetical protein